MLAKAVAVKHTRHARLRLMRRRFRRRLQRAIGIAAFLGVMLFLLDWAGYSGKFRPWGDPRSLSEIWWHFPAIVGAFFFFMMLWPWRIDLHDSI